MSGKLDLIIEQGVKFERTIQIKDKDENVVDIGGDTFEGQVRKRHNSTDTEASFSISITDAENGKISVSIPETTTDDMDAGEYVYDINWTPSISNKVRLLEGIATVSPGVTR